MQGLEYHRLLYFQDISVFISHSTITTTGAIKSVYAPEPFDVGRILQADIILEGQWLTLTTAGPIDPGLV